MVLCPAIFTVSREDCYPSGTPILLLLSNDLTGEPIAANPGRYSGDLIAYPYPLTLRHKRTICLGITLSNRYHIVT